MSRAVIPGPAGRRGSRTSRESPTGPRRGRRDPAGEPAARPMLRRLGAFLGLPILFVAIWSSGYIVGDIGTSAAPPFTLLWWRFLIAFGVMLVVALAGRTRWPRRPIDWLHL